MTSPVRTLAIIRYYRDRAGWDSELVGDPEWDRVDAAIRQMDDFSYPIVLLSCLECESGEHAFADEDAFNVVGGSGRFALFQLTGPVEVLRSTGQLRADTTVAERPGILLRRARGTDRCRGGAANRDDLLRDGVVRFAAVVGTARRIGFAAPTRCLAPPSMSRLGGLSGEDPSGTRPSARTSLLAVRLRSEKYCSSRTRVKPPLRCISTRTTS